MEQRLGRAAAPPGNDPARDGRGRGFADRFPTGVLSEALTQVPLPPPRCFSFPKSCSGNMQSLPGLCWLIVSSNCPHPQALCWFFVFWGCLCVCVSVLFCFEVEGFVLFWVLEYRVFPGLGARKFSGSLSVAASGTLRT